MERLNPSDPDSRKRIISPLEKNLLELKNLKEKLGHFERQRLEEHEAAIEKVINNHNNADSFAGCENLAPNDRGWDGNKVGLSIF